MIITHPSYPNLQIAISNPKYPKFDGSQHCANLPTEAFFHSDYESSEDHGEDWIEPPVDVHPSVRQSRKPYPTYSRHDAFLLQICEGCPFLKECFTHAVHHEEFGFWGGTNPGQRGAIRRKLKLRIQNTTGFSFFGDKDVNRLRDLMSKAREVDADGTE